MLCSASVTQFLQALIDVGHILPIIELFKCNFASAIRKATIAPFRERRIDHGRLQMILARKIP
jgi:hypothetical protein